MSAWPELRLPCNLGHDRFVTARLMMHTTTMLDTDAAVDTFVKEPATAFGKRNRYLEKLIPDAIENAVDAILPDAFEHVLDRGVERAYRKLTAVSTDAGATSASYSLSNSQGPNDDSTVVYTVKI